jgi:hypothetical protein
VVVNVRSIKKLHSSRFSRHTQSTLLSLCERTDGRLEAQCAQLATHADDLHACRGCKETGDDELNQVVN